MPKQSNYDKIMKQFPITDSDAVKIMISLLQTSREIYNEMSSQLSSFGLTQGKFRILLGLFHRQSPLKPSELAKHAGVSRSTMTGLIDGLEHDKFIRRGSHKDGRSTTIYLTEEGIEVMNRLLPFYREHSTKLMSGLTKGECEILNDLLHKLRISLDHLKNK
jgi:MarR family transcriptional regulator, negative regulator of the multidrug operon emrRAB